jgi:plasmid stability protein
MLIICSLLHQELSR